jgi:hypothetical protein
LSHESDRHRPRRGALGIAGAASSRTAETLEPAVRESHFIFDSRARLFHEFSAEQTSAHYGEELDLQLVARTAKEVLTLKYANYLADELFTDCDQENGDMLLFRARFDSRSRRRPDAKK